MGKQASKDTLRPATPMDSVNIVRLLKQQHGESAAALLGPFDDQQVLRYVTAIIGSDRAFSIVVESSSGRLLGSAALSPAPIVFMPGGWLLAEAWFAVVPACRQGTIPGQMLSALGALADQAKTPVLLGSNLLAPEDFDGILSERKDLTIGRTTYIRVPASAKEAAA